MKRLPHPAAILLSVFLATLAILSLPSILSTAKGQSVAPELAPNLGWLNTDKPLRFSDELKGHVVVLDFWTYCCINCMHILPDLEYLEHKYKDQPFVVIGVHSAKFENEGDRQSIRNAVFRYSIQHPVVIDQDMTIWRKYQSRGWPNFVVIDSRGTIALSTGGEGKRQALDAAVQKLLDDGRKNGTLAAKKVEIKPDAAVPSTGGLSFPGKVIASAKNLFIADSTHNRVVVATYPDDDGMCSLVTVFGDAPAGTEPLLTDGDARTARFHDPQGMAFDEARNTLYIADTKNHAVRAIDLAAGTVRTLAGNGQQGRDYRGGKSGRAQALNSPWDLALSPDRNTLFIAMAGPHQLWQLDVSTNIAKVLAGSGQEDIADGSANSAALAQPSGLSLSTDGKILYFADSETSSIRALDLKAASVSTIIGQGLFEFGDIDGAYPNARLQHPLGVTVLPTPDGDRLLVADTYNHKLRLLDPKARTAAGWLGTGRARGAPGDLRLDEPGGLFLSQSPGRPSRLFVADTNNHRVVMIDPATKPWREVVISGLETAGDTARIPASALPATIAAAEGQTLTLSLTGSLPKGAHPNAEAPVSIRVSAITGNSLAAVVAQRTLRTDTFPVTIDIPAAAVKSGAELLVELGYAYCTDGDAAMCAPGDSVWRITVNKGSASSAALEQRAR